MSLSMPNFTSIFPDGPIEIQNPGSDLFVTPASSAILEKEPRKRSSDSANSKFSTMVYLLSSLEDPTPVMSVMAVPFFPPLTHPNSRRCRSPPCPGLHPPPRPHARPRVPFGGDAHHGRELEKVRVSV